MRSILLCILIIGLCTSAYGVWESVGPYGGYLRTLVVSPANEDIMYVGSYASQTKVAKSTNGGTSWFFVGTIPTYTYCMAIDPLNPDVLYAGRYLNVYKSTNGGQTWVAKSTAGRYMYDIEVSPNNSDLVYGAGNVYISNTYMMAFYYSTNAGETWLFQTLNTNRSYGYALAIDPQDNSTIYTGGYYYHPVDSTYYPIIYKSIDGGSTFVEASNGLPNTSNYVYALCVHPTNSNIVYAGLYQGIYRSTDGGGSWTQVSTHTYNYSMTASPANPDVAYCGGYTDMYKTTNAGASWFSASSGLDGRYYYGLKASISQATHVYTACNAGFYRSTNAGSNWFPSNQGICLGAILDFAVAPSSPSTLYTEFEGTGVFKTIDNCSSWTKLATPSACGALCAFVVHNTDADIVYGIEGTG